MEEIKDELFPVIRKRDGRLCRFDINKISEAIYKALYATGIDSKERAELLSSMVIKELSFSMGGTLPQVEEIQDAVESILMAEGLSHTAKAYILYRAKRTSIRDGKSELMDIVEDILKGNDSKPSPLRLSPHDRMMEIAQSASRVFYLSRVIPSHYADAHRKGEIYIHSVEYYDKTIDSLALPLRSFMENGFCGGYAFLNPPKRVSTIAAHAAIILQACQNEIFGEVSFPNFDTNLGSFIEEKLVTASTPDLFQAMEGFVYNLNTLYSKTSFHLPMSSLSIGLDVSPRARDVAFSILKALERGLGNSETPIYPEVVFYVKDGVNLKEGDPNHDLFKKAVEVACRRMNPSFAFADASFNKGKNVLYWGSGARMETQEEKSLTGLGNVASVTINIPRAAMFATLRRADFLMSSFYNELDRLIELCAELLAIRMELVGKLTKSDLPFIMGENVYSGSSELAQSDNIYQAIKSGTLSIGICGLSEGLRILTGKTQSSSDKTHELGIEIVKYIKNAVDATAKKHGLNFVLVSPYELAPSETFFKLDKAEFPDIMKIAVNGIYTQGFMVAEEIPVKERIDLEAGYHPFFDGGHYFFANLKELPNQNEAIEIITGMHKADIGFGGLAFDLFECASCGKIVKRTTECSCDSPRVNHILRETSRLSLL